MYTLSKHTTTDRPTFNAISYKNDAADKKIDYTDDQILVQHTTTPRSPPYHTPDILPAQHDQSAAR